MKTITLFLAIFFAQNCSQKAKMMDLQEKIPAAIEYVYFQRWVGGQELTGSGTNFEIKFKDRLPQNYRLKKVYFQNSEATFESDKYNIFVAHFYQKPKTDIILEGDSKKEYANKVPETTKAKFELKPDEAILEFTNGSKTEQFKISKIEEREMIAYPSARPMDDKN
jgi:hypothetical protein